MYRRALALALRLYPAEFRRLFAHDMLLAFERRYERLRAERGLRAAHGFGVRTIVGTVVRAPLEIGVALRDLEPRSEPRRGGLMSTLGQDLRYGLRTFAKTPTFTALAVVTLALGIGVNATLFSIVNTVLFSELPIRDPDRFAFVWAVHAPSGDERSPMSLPDFEQIRSESRTLEAAAAFVEDAFVLTDGGEPSRLASYRVTANFHDVWGVPIVLGRGFQPGEDAPSAPPVVLLSHGFWERQFGGDPDIVGRTIRLNATAHTVVGVVSQTMEFGDLSRIDVWVPLGATPSTAPRDDRRTLVTVRLAEGATASDASRELETIASRIARDHPDSHDGWSFRFSPTSEEIVNEQDGAVLTVAALSVAFVLLIACVNVANMLMAKATGRVKEVALRLALGASRRRLLRQFLTESFLVSAAAASLGLVLTRGLLDALVLITSSNHWLYRSASIDSRVLFFTVAIAFATPFLFGLAPALRFSKPDVTQTLKDGARAGFSGTRMRWRSLLVAGQIGMAVVLMVVTGLLVRTVISLRTMDFGFEPEGLVAARVDLPESEYATGRAQRTLFNAFVARARATPGVESVALVDRHPFESTAGPRAFVIRGAETDDEAALPTAEIVRVSPDYFDVMHIPVSKGRSFTASDHADGAPVAIVNEVAARRYWRDEEPLGQVIGTGPAAAREFHRIVGVVGVGFDLTRDRPTEIPQIYIAFDQHPSARMSLMVRASSRPEMLAGPLRDHLAALGTELAADVRTMVEIRDQAFHGSNALIALFLIFAGFALAMAAAGIYGVMSFAVSQRGHEIGVRMALGASARDIVWMIAREGARAIVLGGFLGLLAALAVGRLLSSVVVGVSTADPLTFGSVAAILTVVALLANYAPARRATDVEPVAALRSD